MKWKSSRIESAIEVNNKVFSLVVIVLIMLNSYYL